MAVLSATNPTPTPILVGTETDIVSINPGAPLDNISVYFQGGQFGGGGEIELALYAVVGGFRTRVAQARVRGQVGGSLVEFQSIGTGDSETENINAAGTMYIVTAMDLSTGLPSPAAPVRQPITVTLAGVNQFDTVADANFGATVSLAPGQTSTLPTLNGFAQLMDVAVDQTILPGATVTVSADCGLGSVAAIVKQTQLSGLDQDIAAVFQDLVLPVATRYFVSVTNSSTVPFSTTLTAITHSVMPTSGGAVILNGDVIGPSAANTVIKWFNVPLNGAGAGSFAAPPGPTAVPFYNPGLNMWFAFTPSGDVTYTAAGAGTVVAWENVPLDPVSMGAPALGSIPVFTAGAPNHWVATAPGSIVITLSGNATGPSNNNSVEAFGIETVNANVPAAAFVPARGIWYVGVSGMPAAGGANVIINVPVMPSGSQVIVKDEDGGLAFGNTITIAPVGKTIDGSPTLVMTGANPGPFGSRTIMINFNAIPEWGAV